MNRRSILGSILILLFSGLTSSSVRAEELSPSEKLRQEALSKGPEAITAALQKYHDLMQWPPHRDQTDAEDPKYVRKALEMSVTCREAARLAGIPFPTECGEMERRIQKVSTTGKLATFTETTRMRKVVDNSPYLPPNFEVEIKMWLSFFPLKVRRGILEYEFDLPEGVPFILKWSYTHEPTGCVMGNTFRYDRSGGCTLVGIRDVSGYRTVSS